MPPKPIKTEAVKWLLEESFPYTFRQIAIITGCTKKHVREVAKRNRTDIQYDLIPEYVIERKRVVDIVLSLRHSTSTVDGKGMYNYVGFLSWLDVPFSVVRVLYPFVPISLLSTAFNYGNKNVESFNSGAFGIPVSVYRKLWEESEPPKNNVGSSYSKLKKEHYRRK